MGSSAFTVTFDCANPHRQAAFWATALDWTVENNSVLIAALQEAGHIDAEDVTDVDGVASFTAAAAVRDPDDAVDETSGIGQGGRLLFQIVPESKSGKNRVHLDVRVGRDANAAKVEQLISIGATVIGEGEQGGHRWVVLADPEGNEFCVA